MNTEVYKNRLLEEKAKLLKELETIGRINPSNKEDWEAVETDLNTDTADEEDVADAMENFETNTALLDNLEIRLASVNKALKNIEENKYGICEVCSNKIEEDRLSANPAALTCKLHM
jgi:RNA polymerase-binding transcription factor DksA